MKSSAGGTETWLDNVDSADMFNFNNDGSKMDEELFQRTQNGCGTERGPFVSSLLVICSIFDIILIIGLAVLEYVFRWTYLIPIRAQIWSCSQNTSYIWSNETASSSLLDNPFYDFYQQGNIPELIVYIYSFAFPILVIVIGELLLFCLANPNYKPLPTGVCSPINVPHTIRRLYRFSLTFLFGMLVVIVIVEGLKVCLGILRPQFLAICQPTFSCNSKNSSTIYLINSHTISQLCDQTNRQLMKKACTSRPSMRAAISMYSAFYTLIYMHGICAVHHFKYLWLPLLSLTTVLVSILCGIRLIGSKEAWISDVISGHLIGALIALYLGIVYLRCFCYQESVSNRRLLRQIAALSSAEVLTQKRLQKQQSKTSNELSPSIHDEQIVRLRRHIHSPYSPLMTHTTPAPTSTFLPSTKPPPININHQQRKSVTLPISSPHLPPTSTANQSDKITTNEPPNRYSMIPFPTRASRHMLLNKNLPTVSQELIDLLNEKQRNQSQTTNISLGQQLTNQDATSKLT